MKKAFYTVFTLSERYSYTIFPQSIGFISGYFIIYFFFKEILDRAYKTQTG